MTSSQAPSSVLSNIGVLAGPLIVNGVDNNDPDGHVPLQLLLKGTLIIIPLWADPGIDDQLVVTWLQDGFQTPIFDDSLRARINDPFIEVPLSPEQMSMDGIAFVQYRVWKRGGNNWDDSPPRKLTINHTPVMVMKEPCFPDATPWGYLNNNTVPSLTQGVTVFVPPSKEIAFVNDVIEVRWEGYSSLNGSGDPVQGTVSVWRKELDAKDISDGYLMTVPFENYVRPLINNASALACCRLYRESRLIGESKKGLVKIDRVTPGEFGPFGSSVSSLNMEKVTKMSFKLQPAKIRGMGVRSGVLSVDAIVDKLADGSIPISVLDSGILVLQATNFLDPQDNDEIEVKYRVKGKVTWEKVDGLFSLGLASGRVYPVELDVELKPVNKPPLFPEEDTPSTPTIYEVEYEIYKAGGNNADQSTIVEFAIDRTAPYETKVPHPRLKHKPTPSVTITNAPAPPGRVLDEAWMTANPKLVCTVPITYPQRRLDDELEYFLTSGSTVISVFKGEVSATGGFEVDSAVLRTLPNITRISHSYQWKDLPGNLSARSDAGSVFDLRLAQDPVLRLPKVPKTDPNQTTPLYLDDFVTGAPAVLAVIEQPLHGIATDEITLINRRSH